MEAAKKYWVLGLNTLFLIGMQLLPEEAKQILTPELQANIIASVNGLIGIVYALKGGDKDEV